MLYSSARKRQMRADFGGGVGGDGGLGCGDAREIRYNLRYSICTYLNIINLNRAAVYRRRRQLGMDILLLCFWHE